MSKKITCICGCSINENYLRIHIYSRNHLNFITVNGETVAIDYGSVALMEEMAKIEAMVEKEEISEGKYLEECLRLKEAFNGDVASPLLKRDGNISYFNKLEEISYKGLKRTVSQFGGYYYYNYYIDENKKVIMIKFKWF